VPHLLLTHFCRCRVRQVLPPPPPGPAPAVADLPSIVVKRDGLLELVPPPPPPPLPTTEEVEVRGRSARRRRRRRRRSSAARHSCTLTVLPTLGACGGGSESELAPGMAVSKKRARPTAERRAGDEASRTIIKPPRARPAKNSKAPPPMPIGGGSSIVRPGDVSRDDYSPAERQRAARILLNEQKLRELGL
jgi:hypothetical protein